MNNIINKLKKFVTFSIFIYAIILCIFSILNTDINPDAGYTLNTSYFLAWFGKPHIDLNLSHISSLIPMISIVYRVFPNFYSDITPILILIHLSLVISSYILYKIILKLTKDQHVSAIVAVSSYILCICAEGGYLEYEQLVVLSFLSSGIIYFSNNNHIFCTMIAGVLAGFSGTLKQYGFAWIPCLVLVELITNREKFNVITKKILLFLISATLTASTYYILLYYYGHSNLQEFIEDFFGLWYPKEFKTFHKLFSSLFKLDPNILLLVFMPIIFSKKIRDNHVFNANEKLIFSIFLFSVLMLSQSLVQQWPHYLLLSLPGFLLSYIYIFVQLFPNVNKNTLFFVCILLTTHIGFQSYNYVSYLININPRRVQLEEASQIKKIIPYWSKIVVLADPSLNYILKSLPVLPKEIGYNFQDITSEKDKCREIESAEYLLVNRSDIQYFQKLNKRLSETNCLVESIFAKQFSLIAITSDKYEIWRRISR